MKHEESKIQRSIVSTARTLFPKSLIWATPNGGSRNKVTAAILKGEGVLAGVADLTFLHNRRVFFIEVKTEKGKQAPSQKEFQEKVEAMGFPYLIVKSTDEFLKYFLT